MAHSIADISPLIGRNFVSNAGNVGRVQRIGDGAVRVNWAERPSEEDIAEFSVWAEGVLGKIAVTLNVGLKTEASALVEWKRKMGTQRNP